MLMYGFMSQRHMLISAKLVYQVNIASNESHSTTFLQSARGWLNVNLPEIFKGYHF